MSSQAAVIRVAESLIPLPPEAFPKNLSRTGREDVPETMFPILAYDGQNILPTPWGYRSYFATNEKLLKDSVARLLSTVRCENIFWYQSAQLDNVLVALASDGIYITNTDTDVDWIKVVDLAASDTNPLVRKQWSFCTINNITFMYLQGTSSFYGLVDVARYAEAATPTIITGATVSQVAINWNVGVLSYTPTFLNMAGQLGIFKAGNRLGFWDSDTSVSWSSALYVEDFTPSVTTLAGFSKFVDVVGGITKICQHGDGFIIYCTRSIVGVTNNINEKSKFSGRAILSNVGVLFDRQIAVAQPDSLHYVLTSSGLYTITNFNPEVIATEILDGLVEANNYLALDFVDGRYLFINTINGWQSSVIEVEAETNEDFDGNKYVFPPVVYPNPEDTEDLIDAYLKGQADKIKDAFKDYEPIDSPPHVLPEDKALMPCYDIKIFSSTWAETAYSNDPQGTELLDSKLVFGATYLLEDMYGYPTVTVNAITNTNQLPGNFAGQEASDKIAEGITNFSAQLAYQQAIENANLEPKEYEFNQVASIDAVEDQTVTWEKELIERRVTPNCLAIEDLIAKATECRIELLAKQDRLLELLVYLEGTETIEPRIGVCGLGNFSIRPSPGVVLSLNDNEPMTMAYPISQALIEYVYSMNSSMPIDFNHPFWAAFAHKFYPERCVFSHPNIPVGEFVEVGSDTFVETPNLTWLRSIGALSGPLPSGVSEIDYSLETISGWNYGPPNTVVTDFLSQQLYFPINDYSWSKLRYPADIPGSAVPPSWTTADGDAFRDDKFPGTSATQKTLKANFTTTVEINFLPNIVDEIPIFQAEVSGFGYYPSGGFSFRKTHNRHSSTSCPIPLVSFGAKLPVLPTTITPPNYDINNQVTPPYQWEYPPFINLPPNYWLTKKGSAAPLFPTFIRSLVYDTQLEKWGISNMLFKAISSISPVNRSDKTITPKHDYGMLAAILAPDGSVAIVSPNNTASEITYGKLGQYRLGKTKMAYLKFHFKEKFTGTLIVETSLDGRTVAPELTKAADFTDVLSARFPFTLTGEWFNMKVRGSFTLCHIEAFIEGRSRR